MPRGTCWLHPCPDGEREPPYVVPGVSDGGAHTKFITAGTWSTEFLQELVGENDAMSLEDAHWRLSQYPAQAAGMEDRGPIAVGMPADVLVYDFQNLRVLPEEVAYEFPGGEWRRTRRAEGYNYTIVNGVIAFEGFAMMPVHHFTPCRHAP